MSFLDNSKTRILAGGLGYPEGPVYCSDGSILLVEIKNNCLTRIKPDGTREIVLSIPGGPNGAAIGPSADGTTNIYICNCGGFDWFQFPPAPAQPVLLVGGLQPQNYPGGKLQKVELPGKTLTDLFTATESPPSYPPLPFSKWNPPYQLRGPDDLVFDKDGGIWFSDFGKQRLQDRDITGIYYVAPDGSSMRQAIYPLNSPNGIGLSPDGQWLYVALSYERRVLKYEVGPGGTIKPNPASTDGSYLVTGNFVGCSVLDSMAIDMDGNLYVATMLPQGNNPAVNGGITVISAAGAVLDFIEIKLPDGTAVPLPSNLCFGGPDMQTAFITCGGTGYLVSMPSRIPGLRLNFNC